MQCPAALTHPTTVIWDLSPEVIVFDVCVPFLHTVFTWLNAAPLIVAALD